MRKLKAIAQLNKQNFLAMEALGFDRHQLYEEAGINLDNYAPDEFAAAKILFSLNHPPENAPALLMVVACCPVFSK